MKITALINHYIKSISEPQRSEIEFLHLHFLRLFPKIDLWFLDGKDITGKIISNPNIGYGSQMLQYKNGTSKPFYQIGLSSTTKGISVYLLGLKDKNFLIENYKNNIGKAKVSGYCISFKTIKDIDLDILDRAILDCLAQSSATQNKLK